MKLTLGTFASACLEERFGDRAGEAAARAVRQYVDRVESEAGSIEVPTFLRGEPPVIGGSEIDLAIRPEVEAALRDQARRCEVPVERIVSHAVFIMIADLEPPPGSAGGGAAEEVVTALRYGRDARRFDSFPANCEARPAQPRGALVGSDRGGHAGGRRDDAG